MTALPGLCDGRLKDHRLLRQGPLARALEALNGEGEETRLVGGAVRDLALGEPAVDFDLSDHRDDRRGHSPRTQRRGSRSL